MDSHSLLDCDVSGMQGATVVRPVGVLNIHTYPVLRDCLLKCAADQPRAVIVDLGRLEITHARCCCRGPVTNALTPSPRPGP